MWRLSVDLPVRGQRIDRAHRLASARLRLSMKRSQKTTVASKTISDFWYASKLL